MRIRQIPVYTIHYVCSTINTAEPSVKYLRFSISSKIDNLTLSSPSFLFVENGFTVVVGFFSNINLHALQPQSYSCHQSVPHPNPHHRNTLHSQQLPRCHAVYALTLSSLCWLLACLSVFCFSFQFFHAQHYTEEVLCIPCQFQYVLPPCTLSPRFHSASCIAPRPSHRPSHSVATFGPALWLLWAEAF